MKFIRTVKNKKKSEAIALNGINPKDYLNETGADKVEILHKNGSYKNKPKYRIVKTIEKEETPIIELPKMDEEIKKNQASNTPPPITMLMPDARDTEIRFLTKDLNETRLKLDRFRQSAIDYKQKYEKADREIFELKMDHREQLSKIEKENDSGLNGFVEKNPEIVKTLIESFGPALASKFVGGGGTPQVAEPIQQETEREQLSQFKEWITSYDATDQRFLDVVIKMAHITSKNPLILDQVENLINPIN